MPYVTADVRTFIRGKDRFLELIWDQKLERWVLIRYIPNCPGKYELLWMLEGPKGEFMEPRLDTVQEWMLRNDRALIRLCSDKKKPEHFERERHERNRQIKERERDRARDRDRQRLYDHATTANHSRKVRRGEMYTQ